MIDDHIQLILSSMLSSADWNIEVGYIENLNHKIRKRAVGVFRFKPKRIYLSCRFIQAVM